MPHELFWTICDTTRKECAFLQFYPVSVFGQCVHCRMHTVSWQIYNDEWEPINLGTDRLFSHLTVWSLLNHWCPPHPKCSQRRELCSVYQELSYDCKILKYCMNSGSVLWLSTTTKYMLACYRLVHTLSWDMIRKEYMLVVWRPRKGKICVLLTKKTLVSLTYVFLFFTFILFSRSPHKTRQA